MNVASLELSKKLYELSGWKNTVMEWDEIEPRYVETPYPDVENGYYPAYDCGYLLRKLPVDFSLEYHGHQHDKKELGYKDWHLVCYNPRVGTDFIKVEANTPEDALAKLAIRLFETGVLEREDTQ